MLYPVYISSLPAVSHLFGNNPIARELTLDGPQMQIQRDFLSTLAAHAHMHPPLPLPPC
jgi:hypothetical protein